MSPDGRDLFAATSSENGVIAQFEVAPDTGLLTASDPATVPAGPRAVGLTIDRGSRNAYVANQVADGTVTQFRLFRRRALPAEPHRRWSQGAVPVRGGGGSGRRAGLRSEQRLHAHLDGLAVLDRSRRCALAAAGPGGGDRHDAQSRSP